jgi:hypothetical protein
MAHIDTALVEQILDVSKGQREPDIHHYRQADNLGARLEPFEGALLGRVMPRRSPSPLPHLKPSSSDKAAQSNPF